MKPDDPDPSRTAYRRGPHWVAVLAAAFTWPLIFVGGSVTTYRVGLAVPDWPTTFGINMFLYNFWNAPFGVRIEHTHRLYGAAVGLATIVLAGWLLAAERRRSLKVLGVVALLAVIGQGVLGGLRVTHTSTLLAAVHGVTGQAFFALMVSLCVLTGRDWVTARDRLADPAHLRRRSAVTLALIAAQLVAGAWLRHFGSNGVLAVHATLAAAVWGHAALVSWRVERLKAVVPELVPAARALTLTVMLQVALGIAAWWVLPAPERAISIPQAMIRTAHQANGALVLASAVVLSLRALRHLAPARAEHRHPARLDWEVVA